MTKVIRPITLDATQRNYVLQRIITLRDSKLAALRAVPSDLVEKKRLKAKAVVDAAHPEHVKNALLAQFGYPVPGYKVSGNSLYTKVTDAVRKVGNPTPAVLASKTNAIITEATRLTDLVMLGGTNTEFSALLRAFAAFTA